ncbi:dual specificity mitogen-activated protein kinase kinase 7 isoform X1 [Nilaparvata lugens]|uniref:dual specificity mitogen-activated protein kinase kinase 7 isoform X1 n=1 Tax=Nilaparvata lugens TaxID=108931 RepID=UPI000B989CB2|nr:dual specificity mitogen-activated protein kinase kinase 7 isoform X1 [Nilaparvata lugens]
MASSSFENKVMDLEARLKAENESHERDNKLPRDFNCFVQSPKHSERMRPNKLGDLGTPTVSRRSMVLPISSIKVSKNPLENEIDNKMKEIMEMSGLLTIDGKKFQTDIKDMKHLGELGNGTCGHVVKMLHKPSQTIIAIKQMRRSGNSEENKRIIMDLDVVLKSHDCPYIVRCLGCFITDADVWICMELMATCFDKLLKRFRQPVPENILGKIALSTVKALNYLKESHGVIHRDVKPSNILLDERGNVKLCDFGISGRLVDSKAKTKNAGCAAYMAPERIDPPDPKKPDYDIRADVWSLGITLVELATGVFPYRDCKSDFEVLSKVIQEDPPTLPTDQGFTPEFRSFVESCLTKDHSQRPKYKKLLEHSWLRRFEVEEVNVAEWFAKAIETPSPATPTSLHTRRITQMPVATSVRRPPPPPVVNHHSHRLVTSAEQQHQPNGNAPSPSCIPCHYPPLSGRFSPCRAAEPPPVSPRLSSSPIPSEWDRNRNIGLGSPLPMRKRNTYEGVNHFNHHQPQPQPQPQPYYHHHNQQPYYHHHNQQPSSLPLSTSSSSYSHHQQQSSPYTHQQNHVQYGNTSPLPQHRSLNHHYHQQHQHLQHYSFPVTHHRSTSVSPCRQYTTSTSTSEGVRVDESGKKRYSSGVKFQIGGMVRHPSPSPDPPPRYNRGTSPLLMGRRTFLDGGGGGSPLPSVRRDSGSPSLSRRHVSPSPPQPPPRRLSSEYSGGGGSVPGSPQHSFRPQTSRLHHTPEPQRRIWTAGAATADFHDL